MKRQRLQEMKQMVLADKMVLSPRLRRWGGADVLVVEPKGKEISLALTWLYDGESEVPAELQNLQAEDARLESGMYIQRNNMHLLITNQALELSAILERIKRLFADVIDFANKYHIYGRLAEAAGMAFGMRDARVAMIEEAIRMAEEFQPNE
jgi:hypothetical protein